MNHHHSPHLSRDAAAPSSTLVGTCKRFGFTRWMAVFVLALGLQPDAALAQTRVSMPVSGALKTALEARGDLERGRSAYADCQGCHGKTAAGRGSGAIPRLSGQHASVLIKQLLDIRSGERINPAMKRFVETDDMTPQVFADIAVYLQALPMAGTAGTGPGTALARGEALYGQRCAACHGARGEGQPELFIPLLAAQHHGYLLRELGMIRDGNRGNSNPAMVQMLQALGAEDFSAVADYLSRLPAPARP